MRHFGVMLTLSHFLVTTAAVKLNKSLKEAGTPIDLLTGGRCGHSSSLQI